MGAPAPAACWSSTKLFLPFLLTLVSPAAPAAQRRTAKSLPWPMPLLPAFRLLPRRAGLLLAGVVLTLAAHGQQILTDPDGESCRVTPECKEHKYEFKPDPGQTFLRWQVRGDLALLS